MGGIGPGPSLPRHLPACHAGAGGVPQGQPVFNCPAFFKLPIHDAVQVLEAYRKSSKYWSATLNRFAEVRTRGRKRSMVG